MASRRSKARERISSGGSCQGEREWLPEALVWAVAPAAACLPHAAVLPRRCFIEAGPRATEGAVTLTKMAGPAGSTTQALAPSGRQIVLQEVPDVGQAIGARCESFPSASICCALLAIVANRGQWRAEGSGHMRFRQPSDGSSTIPISI